MLFFGLEIKEEIDVKEEIDIKEEPVEVKEECGENFNLFETLLEIDKIEESIEPFKEDLKPDDVKKEEETDSLKPKSEEEFFHKLSKSKYPLVLLKRLSYKILKRNI
ncbi:hypothetical protein Avbf_11177 [Armadillidium vulgare]|nr:hypothetical protein Avbf_11177 [Armadillidium vulgare]